MIETRDSLTVRQGQNSGEMLWPGEAKSRRQLERRPWPSRFSERRSAILKKY